FNFAAAIDGLVTAFVGGSTLFLGPLLGSGFLTLVPELQRWFGIEAGWIRPFLAGVLLLAVILFLPGGLAGLIAGRTRVPAPAEEGEAAGRAHPERGAVVAELVGVSKEYGGVHAVADVDLELRGGEVVRLIGPN